MEAPDDLVPPPADLAPEAGLRFVSMIADDGREPPASTTDAEALGAWSAASCPWHPALLARAADLPRFEDVALPTDPEAGEVRLVAAGQLRHLPAGYRDRAEAAGVPLIEATADRAATVRAIAAALGQADPGDDPLAADYLALGSAHWWIRDLTIAMGHVDTLARPTLLREAKAGGLAWTRDDRTAAENHLRAGFELLAQARERFYPMDGYVLDFCLLDPATPPDGLVPLLDSGKPFTLVAPALAIDRLAAARPDLAGRLRDAIGEGWADVVGGAYAEVDEPFLPWSSLAWQFARGSTVYRRHLDDRNVETLARRRFGLYPQLPQVAKRFGIRYAWLVALDAGRFPVVPESKRQWAGPDGTCLEAITRPPLGADRPAEGGRLAWRMAQSMRDDQVATLPLARWPDPVAPWFADLRRSARYAAVLGRWVTANDYFQFSDRPFEEVTLAPDDLATAYLAQAAARRDPSPIGRRVDHARCRAWYDAIAATHALAATLAGTEDEPLSAGLEDRVETEPGPGLIEELAGEFRDRAAALARLVVGAADGGTPGYFVFNPAGITRRVAVTFPGGGRPIPDAGKALKANQPSGEVTAGTVELAPFGFAWFAADPAGVPAGMTPFGSVSVRNQTISHESLIVGVDPATGGIRGINGVGEESARIGQQLVIQGLLGPDGKPAASRMRATRVEVESRGPAVASIRSEGAIHDPATDRPLARFTQRVTLASGNPTLRLDIRLHDLDPAWLARVAEADPWAGYLACRWAWPDPQSTLRRSALLAMYPTEAERPETPGAIEITSRQRRTTLLCGGLAHHRRQGPRMLDTLLVAGSESARTFGLAVNLNIEHAFASILDRDTPVGVVATTTAAAPASPVGWLLRVDHKAVAVARLAFAPSTNEGHGWGLVVDLIETAGQAARCQVRACRPILHARQVNGHGEHLIDLQFDPDGASVDLTPHEIARVELTFGPPPSDAAPGDIADAPA